MPAPAAQQLSFRSLRRTRAAGETRTTILVAFSANVLVLVVKLVAGLLSGSTALLAEAAHSLADTVNQGFLLVSIALSRRPPTPDNPFGHGAQRFLWTFIAALGTFLAGAVFAMGYAVVELLRGPAKEGGYTIAWVALGLAAIAEATSLLRAVRQARREARAAGVSLRVHVRRSRDPSAKLVLFEDSVAVAGVAVAAAGIGIDELTGATVFDPLASLLIGLLLVAVAFVLGRDSARLLVGGAALPDERAEMTRILESAPEVLSVRQLLTMTLGPNALLVAARVDLDDAISAGRVERLLSDLDLRLRQAVPDVTEVFLDPTPADEREAGDLP